MESISNLAIAPRTTDELAVGTEVGEYRIECKIGSGGMGVVYGARHPLIGKRAAIKVLNRRYSSDCDAIERFVLEAQAVNRVAHSGIVDIFSFGELPDGRSYFVMEWLQGETLGRRMERGPLPLTQVLSIVTALARSLEAAHSAGVVHRDLKPDNVFLVAEGDSVLVKLLDFGIAKLTDVESEVHRTATGAVVGTPLYMSPEQAKGVEVDARTDHYSLGVLAYAMLSGVTPFQSETSSVEVLHAHIFKPPPPLGPDIPPHVATMVLGLLAKDPAERISLAMVRGVASGISTAPVDPPIKRSRSMRWLGFTLGGAAAIASGFIVFALLQSDPVRETPDRSSARVATPVAAVIAIDAPPAAKPPVDATRGPDSIETGRVRFVIKPRGARVTIGGKTVDASASVVVAPGRHDVLVTAPGYIWDKREVNVAAGGMLELSITLKRPRPSVDPDGAHNPFGGSD